MPKIIHCIWLDDYISKEYLSYMEIQNLPINNGYTIKRWKLNNLSFNNCSVYFT
ncbi:MAG: hypothetical protein ACI4SM_01315 [Candidatus Gastranaerophilaceae bacterium]